MLLVCELILIAVSEVFSSVHNRLPEVLSGQVDLVKDRSPLGRSGGTLGSERPDDRLVCDLGSLVRPFRMAGTGLMEAASGLLHSPAGSAASTTSGAPPTSEPADSNFRPRGSYLLETWMNLPVLPVVIPRTDPKSSNHVSVALRQNECDYWVTELALHP